MMRDASSVVKLAVLATHPIQYQVPVWRALASRENVILCVFYGSDIGARTYRDVEFGRDIKWDVPITSGYPHAFLSRNPSVQSITPWRPGASGLLKKLREFGPDVLLFNAYGGRFWIEALLAGRTLGLPVILRHEASDCAVRRSRVKGWLRTLVLRAFYGQISGFPVIGIAAREHLLRCGVQVGMIGRAPYNVDSDFFIAEAARWLPQRARLRSKLGISESDVTMLFSGKLISKKGPNLIVAAMRRLPPEIRRRLHWCVVGDGELRAQLQKEAHELFGNRAHFAGFVNQRELGQWYAVADFLVLPSLAGRGETWGLVVNEAFHFGLPAIVSDGVGCQPDLVPDDRFGRIFRSGDPDSLALAIRQLAEELPAGRQGYAASTQAAIALFTTGRAVDGIVEIARRVVGTKALV